MEKIIDYSAKRKEFFLWELFFQLGSFGVTFIVMMIIMDFHVKYCIGGSILYYLHQVNSVSNKEFLQWKIEQLENKITNTLK